MSFDVAAIIPPLFARLTATTTVVPAAPLAVPTLMPGPATPDVAVGVGATTAGVGVGPPPPPTVIVPLAPPTVIGLALASDAPGVFCNVFAPAVAPAAILKLHVNRGPSGM